MRTIFLQLILLLLIPLALEAHPWKSDKYVIVETDGGLDDFRALNMMLATPSIRILGIVCSSGVLPAGETHKKVNQLLQAHHHEGILTSINFDAPQPELKISCAAALNFNWGDSITIPPSVSMNTMVQTILDHTQTKLTYVCLGSLANVNQWITSNPDKKEQFEKIIWTVDATDLKNSFNNKLAPKTYPELSAEFCKLDIIHANLGLTYTPDESIIGELNNNYALSFISSLKVNSEFATTCFDELAVLYLHHPELYQTATYKEINYIQATDSITSFFEEEIAELLEGQTGIKTQVFKSFTSDTADFQYDVQNTMLHALKQYGTEEWQACVLTSEMHRHLGVFALMGSKMGIRAREYFGVGVDELRVISYAGSNPPISCLNDGLQVSTGASIGHGLITVANDSIVEPRADFEYMGQKITISLKTKYRKRIRQDVLELKMLYGLESDLYWELLRKRALVYWRNWDRHDVFIIEH